MRKSLLALGVLSSALALASGDVWLWKDGKYYKNEAIDSITFENPLTAASHYNVNDKECHTPTVTRITEDHYLVNEEGAELESPIYLSGKKIILHGTNLNYVDSVFVRGTLVYSKDWENCGENEYYNSDYNRVSRPCKSDTTLRLSLPSFIGIQWEGDAIFYVYNCTDPITLDNVSFYDEDAAPEIYMIYNEFVADGDYMKVKGNYLRDNLAFDFIKSTGDTVTASGSDVSIKSSDNNEAYVKVPNGVGVNVKIIVRNEDTGKQSECPILLRDCRNMLVDFDTNTDLCLSLGGIKRASDGTYNVTAYTNDWVTTVESNYSLTKTNQFGVISPNEDSWGTFITYAPSWDEEEDVPRTVWGAFKDSVMKDPASALNYVVKFEVNVPASYPTNYAVYSLGFVSADEALSPTYRDFAACLQMSEITWDKSDADLGWQISRTKDFSTDGWMTVTVPMSEFLWNLENKLYITSAQNFTTGNLATSDDEAFGDPTGHTSYCAYYADKLTNEDGMYYRFGGLMFGFNASDCHEYSSNTNKAAHFAIDNIRIVPNDGNGAIYPKTKYGVPSQHYYEKPRTKAFK